MGPEPAWKSIIALLARLYLGRLKNHSMPHAANSHNNTFQSNVMSRLQAGRGEVLQRQNV